MKDDIVISCPKCGQMIDISEAILSKDFATRMGVKAMEENLDPRYKDFYHIVYAQEGKYEHFHGIYCKVCEYPIVVAHYDNDSLFSGWEIMKHHRDCPMIRLEKGEL